MTTSNSLLIMFLIDNMYLLMKSVTFLLLICYITINPYLHVTCS